MKRRPIQIFLVIVISFSIPALSTYFYYYDLAQTDFSCDLSFENPDQEDLLIDQQNQSKVFVSRVFPRIFLLGANLFEEVCPFSIPDVFSRSKNPASPLLILFTVLLYLRHRVSPRLGEARIGTVVSNGRLGIMSYKITGLYLAQF